MKIIKEENAEKFNYADTSSVLEYGSSKWKKYGFLY